MSGFQPAGTPGLVDDRLDVLGPSSYASKTSRSFQPSRAWRSGSGDRRSRPALERRSEVSSPRLTRRDRAARTASTGTRPLPVNGVGRHRKQHSQRRLEVLRLRTRRQVRTRQQSSRARADACHARLRDDAGELAARRAVIRQQLTHAEVTTSHERVCEPSRLFQVRPGIRSVRGWDRDRNADPVPPINGDQSVEAEPTSR